MISARRWAAVGLLGLAGSAGAESVPATVEWAERVNLGVPVSGIVEVVAVDVDDRVSQGQELLRLEATPFKAHAKRAQARLRHAQAAHAEQVRARERAEELYERGALSTVELDHAKLLAVEAESARRAAEAEVEIAQFEMEKARIAAPFDAWVVAREVNAGEIVSSELAPKTLLTLARAGVYVARARVSRAALDTLDKGRVVTVRMGERALAGTVHRIGREPEAGAGQPQYAVDVRFQAADVAPRVGDAVTVEWR
ncbi:MAG: efflux RND transporter periplasmic adaptor subunit [Gammaproteobacteria bacterium]|nr:efflux RND transporter periplasmic adaptor subunit [Gammaproteobacteria bacterium]